MCYKHQWLLVHQAGYSEQDPWQSLIAVAQLALFQAVISDSKAQKLTGGEVEKISEFGCLACFKPDAFGEIVEAAKTKDLKNIKDLGDKWVDMAESNHEP